MLNTELELKQRTSAGADEPLRILVIDDQSAVRRGLSQLLGGDPRVPRTVCTAANAQEAMGRVEEQRPHVVVLDVDLAGDDGLALLPRLIRAAPVVVFSCHDDDATRQRALSLGAGAFVPKGASAAELVEAIDRLAAHGLAGGMNLPSG